MLSNVVLDREFCAEILSYARHLINRLLIAVKQKKKTSLEIWSDHSATDYDSLYIFGYPICYDNR